MDQFEHFETKRFVQRLLGKGDMTGLMEKVQDIIPEDKQPEMLESIAKVRCLRCTEARTDSAHSTEAHTDCAWLLWHAQPCCRVTVHACVYAYVCQYKQGSCVFRVACLQGNVTMRVMRDMFESVLELGPMSQVRHTHTHTHTQATTQWQ